MTEAPPPNQPPGPRPGDGSYGQPAQPFNEAGYGQSAQPAPEGSYSQPAPEGSYGQPAQPAYGATPAPGQAPGAPGPYYQPPATEDPGKTLGIIGLVLSFFTAVIGLIISAIALSRSRKAGFKNTPALIGVILGAIGTVVGIILIIVTISVAASVANQCAQLGPGVHQQGGVTIRCGG